MVNINRYAWAIMEILGMVLLVFGAFGVMGLIGLGHQASIGLMVLGIMLILISSIFIQIEGHELRKEDDGYRRFEEVRDEARLVPDNLNEGYVIDYTAEPGKAVSYRSNDPESVQLENNEHSDCDVRIIYK
jgi:hypothetical protein